MFPEGNFKSSASFGALDIWGMFFVVLSKTSLLCVLSTEPMFKVEHLIVLIMFCSLICISRASCLRSFVYVISLVNWISKDTWKHIWIWYHSGVKRNGISFLLWKTATIFKLKKKITWNFLRKSYCSFLKLNVIYSLEKQAYYSVLSSHSSSYCHLQQKIFCGATQYSESSRLNSKQAKKMYMHTVRCNTRTVSAVSFSVVWSQANACYLFLLP